MLRQHVENQNSISHYVVVDLLELVHKLQPQSVGSGITEGEHLISRNRGAISFYQPHEERCFRVKVLCILSLQRKIYVSFICGRKATGKLRATRHQIGKLLQTYETLKIFYAEPMENMKPELSTDMQK